MSSITKAFSHSPRNFAAKKGNTCSKNMYRKELMYCENTSSTKVYINGTPKPKEKPGATSHGTRVKWSSLSFYWYFLTCIRIHSNQYFSNLRHMHCCPSNYPNTQRSCGVRGQILNDKILINILLLQFILGYFTLGGGALLQGIKQTLHTGIFLLF